MAHPPWQCAFLNPGSYAASGEMRSASSCQIAQHGAIALALVPVCLSGKLAFGITFADGSSPLMKAATAFSNCFHLGICVGNVSGSVRDDSVKRFSADAGRATPRLFAASYFFNLQMKEG
jgi:hypothetical protein